MVLTIDVGLADIAAIRRRPRARAKSGEKPVLTCIMDGAKASKTAATSGEMLPNYVFPEDAARVLGKLARYAEWRDQPEGIILDFDDIRPQEAQVI